MKKLRYGIIGTGGISAKHLSGYSALEDEVEIVAACDIDQGRLSDASKKYGIPRLYADYNELLSQPDIDFVSICLPNWLHCPVTVAALEAGKNVHCEKPMALNHAEAQKMLDAKNKSGKKLMLGLNNRFTPYALFVKKFVEEGNLGEIYYSKCGWQRRAGLPHSGWYANKDLSGGGALIDLGVHFIDLVMYFMNYPLVSSVSANTYSKFVNRDISPIYTYQGQKVMPGMKFDVDDLSAGFIELENGASIAFEISWASNIEKEKVYYDLYGTKAGISFSNDFVSDPQFKIFSTINGQLTDIVPQVNGNLYEENEFRHFANCVRTGTEPEIALPEQGVAMMKIIDAIYESSESKKPIIY